MWGSREESFSLENGMNKHKVIWLIQTGLPPNWVVSDGYACGDVD